MFSIFKKKSPIETPKPTDQQTTSEGWGSFGLPPTGETQARTIEKLNNKVFQIETPTAFGHAMDSCPSGEELVNPYTLDGQSINPVVLDYFANTAAFIGYQNCAILAQKKLMSVACTIKAKEAVKNWFELAFTDMDQSTNSGEKVTDKIISYIRGTDKKYKVKNNIVKAEQFKNVFGIRHVLFRVESIDPDYYLKPFNIDSVSPGSYKGMHQVDPIFITPEFSESGLSDPLSPNFYNPLYWVINGVKIHRSHFVIIYGDEVPDLLKPSYRYGGVPLVQQLYERLYKAERTANEAPELALTKRLNVRKTNLSKALANGDSFLKRMQDLVTFRDNYGVLIADNSEEIQQLDTTLSDFTDVVNNQYQLFAAEATIPAAKLLSTSPQGMNATGEFEMKNYNQTVSDVQENIMSPILYEHYKRLLRSEIYPEFGVSDLEIDIRWLPLDNPTAIDTATVENLKSQTDLTLVQTQAITPENVRERLSQDPNSQYFNIKPFEDEPIDDEPIDDEPIDEDKQNEDLDVDDRLNNEE